MKTLLLYDADTRRPRTSFVPFVMKLRKRHRIVLLFWLPFWAITAGMGILAIKLAGFHL